MNNGKPSVNVIPYHGFSLCSGLFATVFSGKMQCVKLVTEEFFFNNEKHETTRKKFIGWMTHACNQSSFHEILSGLFGSFVVKTFGRKSRTEGSETPTPCAISRTGRWRF